MNKNYNEIQLNTDSKTKVFKSFVPREFHDKEILEIDNKVYFSIDIVSKYLVFLKKESIIKKKKCKVIDNKQYVDTTSIDEILVDCGTSDNKFRTIDINKELGRIKVKENNRYLKKLGTSLHEVQDYELSIKYTKEARFLYAVDKYLKYLKHETKEKVFLNEIELIHPQYKDMKNNFRYDLYLPSAKICIEYLEEYHNTKQKTEQDLIRKQVIEYEDVLVMSYNYSQTDEDADVYLANFLLNLKDNIVDRSLYFTKNKLTIDQYLYVFQKNGISDTSIARKMLEIRNKDDNQIDIPLVDAFDMILLRKDNYDKALELIENKLDKDDNQYKYDNDFTIDNIYLNKTGFCDFCVLIGTRKSKEILKYYREVESMCINMINEKVKYIEEQTEKKKKFKEVVHKLIRDNWYYHLQVDNNTLNKKCNYLVKSNSQEIKFNRNRNKEQKKTILKIMKLIDKVNDNKIGNLAFKNKIIKVVDGVKFLKKEKEKENVIVLEDSKPVFPEFDCLIYIEEDDLEPVYLSDVVQKYNQYNSSLLTQNDFKKMLEKYSNQIEIINSSSFSGKCNKLKLTNVRWLSEDELNEEDSDEDSDEELNSEISTTKTEESDDSESEFEVEIDES